MADSEDKKSRDEIRVVGDEEEVIRLDSPRSKPVEKSGKAVVEAFRSSEKVGGTGDGKTSEAPADEREAEVAWGDEFSGEEKDTAVPMGWFYLLGVGLVGVIVWMGFQIAFKDGGSGVEGGLVVAPGGGSGLEKADEARGRLEAEKHFKKMEEVVAGFLAAETVEERVKFVRHPERVLPLMKDFHERRPLRTFRYEKVSNYMTTSLSFRPFIALAVVTEEDGNLPVLVEDSPEGPLVDWESFVCFQPISPEKFLEKRPTEPVSLRVYTTFDNYYAYEFSKEEEYLCFKLQFRGSETVLFGYVKRGSKVEQKFRDIYSLSGANKSKPLILKVRFLEDSKAKRGVLIEDLESSLWAFANNPAEESQ